MSRLRRGRPPCRPATPADRHRAWDPLRMRFPTALRAGRWAGGDRRGWWLGCRLSPRQSPSRMLVGRETGPARGPAPTRGGRSPDPMPPHALRDPPRPRVMRAPVGGVEREDDDAGLLVLGGDPA